MRPNELESFDPQIGLGIFGMKHAASFTIPNNYSTQEVPLLWSKIAI